MASEGGQKAMTTETLDYPIIQKGNGLSKAKSPAEVKKMVSTVTATDFELTQAA